MVLATEQKTSSVRDFNDLMPGERSADVLEIIENQALKTPATIDQFVSGLTWSYAKIKFDDTKTSNIGLAMSPMTYTRTLRWPGTIAGQKVSDFSRWLKSWDAHEATLGLSCCNAVINRANNVLIQSATPLPTEHDPNLAVFLHFKAKLKNKKIAVIGRYPGMDDVLSGLDYTVIERHPEKNDLPDPAAEFVLPEMDWVFISATTLLNKTFTRLSKLSSSAVTVLMGPSTPWLREFEHFGIDFIAGVTIDDAYQTEKIVCEGGGKRLFEGGVSYAINNISTRRLSKLKIAIADVADRRILLRAEMDAWYQQSSMTRFSKWAELEGLDQELSLLDTAYKRLWDANQ